MAGAICEDEPLGIAGHLHHTVLSDQVLDRISAYNAVHPFLNQSNLHYERYHFVSLPWLLRWRGCANSSQDGHCRGVDLSCELGGEVPLPEHVLPSSTRAATEGAGC